MGGRGVSAAVAGVAVMAVATATLAVLRSLARRVVAVEPRRPTVMVTATDGVVQLPASVHTRAPGRYGLWFGERLGAHALVGEVIADDGLRVTRHLLAATAAVPDAPFPAYWSSQYLRGPGDTGMAWSEVSIPLRDGGTAPAWFFPATDPTAPWAIHVQGLRTSRLGALRAVEAAQSAGYASLVITYRGAGDGAPASASGLGLLEWIDLADAVAYARRQGAPRVTVMAWSMGAGLALEVARREPDLIDDLVLICPATNWREIIRHGAHTAGLPRVVGSAAAALLCTPVLSRLVGLRRPLDLSALDWTRPGGVSLPTLVVHTAGDELIPVEHSHAFAHAHPRWVTLAITDPAPHGYEPNVDPTGFAEAIAGWSRQACERSGESHPREGDCHPFGGRGQSSHLNTVGGGACPAP